MIIKKKILSNEIIKRRLKGINLKDRYLFEKDVKRSINSSYTYTMKNMCVFPDGKIQTFSNKIVNDYLGFTSLSKVVLLKKIILKIKYFLSIIFKNAFYPKKIIKDKCFIIYNRNSNGYFHWTIDTLPKILITKNIDKKISLALPDTLNIKFVVQSLKKFKVQHFFMKKGYKYHFNQAIYIGELYPSGSPRKNILNNLRNKIKQNLKSYKKIYISRNNSQRRKISNEKELIKILKKYNFKIIYSENLSFSKQISLFSSAKYVIGLHGAGISNILWMKKNSKLFELKPEKDLFLNCYFNMAELLGIKYAYIICKKENFFLSSKNSDFSVDIKNFEKKLKNFFII